MSIRDAFDYGAIDENRFGRRVQRITALCIAGAFALAANARGDPDLYNFTGVFALAAAFPVVIGRLIAAVAAIVCANIAIIAVQSEGLATWALGLSLAAPILLLAAILAHRGFAAFAGAALLALALGAFARRS